MGSGMIPAMKAIMRSAFHTAFVLAAIVALGCDDRPSVPASVLEQAKKQEQQPKGPKIPTTHWYAIRSFAAD